MDYSEKTNTKTIADLKLPEAAGSNIHQNRLMKLAREGGAMTSQHLRDLEPERRYATVMAVLLDTRATVIGVTRRNGKNRTLRNLPRTDVILGYTLTGRQPRRLSNRQINIDKIIS